MSLPPCLIGLYSRSVFVLHSYCIRVAFSFDNLIFSFFQTTFLLWRLEEYCKVGMLAVRGRRIRLSVLLISSQDGQPVLPRSFIAIFFLDIFVSVSAILIFSFFSTFLLRRCRDCMLLGEFNATQSTVQSTVNAYHYGAGARV